MEIAEGRKERKKVGKEGGTGRVEVEEPRFGWLPRDGERDLTLCLQRIVLQRMKYDFLFTPDEI
jgi:hypothetical protein